MDGASPPDPATMVRLAAAYDQAGKPDEAIAVLTKVLAMPNLNPVDQAIRRRPRRRAPKQAKNAKK